MDNYNQQYGGYPQAPQQGNPAATEYCANCGAVIPQGSVYCASCGQARSAANPAANYSNAYSNAAPTYSNAAPPYGKYNPNPDYRPNMPPAGEYVSKSDYLKKYASEPFKKGIKTAAIIGYVLTGILALSILATPLAVIDMAIYLALTLGMHLAKNKLCAFGILGYGIFGCVLNLVLSGAFTGWGWIAVGAYAVSLFNKEEKQYASYMASRQY